MLRLGASMVRAEVGVKIFLRLEHRRKATYEALGNGNCSNATVTMAVSMKRYPIECGLLMMKGRPVR